MRRSRLDQKKKKEQLLFNSQTFSQIKQLKNENSRQRSTKSSLENIQKLNQQQRLVL